jgi:regulator of protease activity HflC (stomatin/prohibitin superfamily)
MISDDKPHGAIIGLVAVLSIFIILFLLIGIRIVRYDEYAIEKTFSGKLYSYVYDPGFRWLGFSSLIRVNNQVRNYEVVVEAASKDYQDVNMIVNLNMVIKKDKVYDFVKNYQSEEQYVQYLNNKIQEKIKTIIIKYDAEEVLNNRLEISKELYGSVADMPELTYFKINDLAIKNIQFSEKFSETLERKAQISIEQDILTRQKDNLELLKANMKIVDIDTYFKYQLIEKWDGKSNLIISDALLTSQAGN